MTGGKLEPANRGRRQVLLGTTAAAMAGTLGPASRGREAMAQSAGPEPRQVALGARSDLAERQDPAFESLPTLARFGKRPGDDVSDVISEAPYVVITEGVYYVRSDATVNGILHFMGGALSVDRGATLRIPGQIIAPLQQVFYGRGRFEGPPRATEVRPEWFGCIGDGHAPDPSDDTGPMQRAIGFAGGGVLRLSSLYGIMPEKLRFGAPRPTGLVDGISVLGNSYTRTKGEISELTDRSDTHFGPITGFVALADGEWLIQTMLDHAHFEGVTFEGNGKTLHHGIMYCRGIRTTKFWGCSWRQCRGPGLVLDFAEDVTFSGCQFVHLGVEPHKNKYGHGGGILFGNHRGTSKTPSNVVFFTNHCRFEWMDGGYFNLIEEPGNLDSYPYADDYRIGGLQHCLISDCKFEIGRNRGWGDTRELYGIFNFELANDRAARRDDKSWSERVENFAVHDCWINGVSTAKYLVRVRHADCMSFQGNMMSLVGPTAMVEFVDGGPKAFVMKDNQARQPWGTPSFANQLDNADYDYKYEDPLFGEKIEPGKRQGRNLLL